MCVARGNDASSVPTGVRVPTDRTASASRRDDPLQVQAASLLFDPMPAGRSVASCHVQNSRPPKQVRAKVGPSAARPRPGVVVPPSGRPAGPVLIIQGAGAN